MRRDPASLVFAMLIPAFQIILFGFAIDFDVRHIDTVVVDMDRSRESRAYVSSLRNTQYMLVVAQEASPDRALAMIRRGEARVAVILAGDFARNPVVQVLVDGSDAQVASRIVSALRPPGSFPPGAPQPHVQLLYNPGGKTAPFSIPGLIGIILHLVTVSLTSLSLVREKEQGTLEQVMVSPVGRLGLMLGKIVPYAVLAMAEMLAVLTLGWLVFDVGIRGSLAELVFMSVPFVMATLGLGLLISTLAQNQAQAVQMMILSLLPSVLLSGFIFPRESMPGPLYVLSCLIPVTYFIQILRGVILRGAGLGDLWSQTLVLWLIALALIGLATSRFRKSIA